jgi:hypothetical protein
MEISNIKVIIVLICFLFTQSCSGINRSYGYSPGKWIPNKGIINLIKGNTAEIYFLDGGNVDIVYFDENSKVFAIRKNSASKPLFIANWYVENNNLCMYSGEAPMCYYMIAKKNHIEGWVGSKKSMLLGLYKGDTFKLIQHRQQYENNKSWKAIAIMAGLAIVGTTLLAIMSSGNNSSSVDESDPINNSDYTIIDNEGNKDINDNNPTPEDTPGDCYWGYESLGTCVP